MLHAIDFPYPLARNANAQPQPLRSSTAERMAELVRKAAEVRRLTGRDKGVLIGSSRGGGDAIRDYLNNGGGAAYVSPAILGGTPNHGVFHF